MFSFDVIISFLRFLIKAFLCLKNDEIHFDLHFFIGALLTQISPIDWINKTQSILSVQLLHINYKIRLADVFSDSVPIQL